MSFDLDKCRSKDELEAFAKDMFGVDLDKRKKLDELKGEVRALMSGPAARKKEAVDEPQPELVGAVIPEFVLNPTTKGVFLNHPGLKKKLETGKLVACDKNGKPV